MDKLDKIKGIIAICIVTVAISSFVFLGQNHPITRYIAVGGIIIWLITMFIINRAKKNSEE